MTTTISATFQVTSWDETPFDEASGGIKLTEALVERRYSGDIEGTSATKWLMAYAPDETASFVGLERIHGVVGGRDGTLVIQHAGRFENGAATAELTVLSGGDQLNGSSGSGRFTADPAGSIELDLTIPAAT